MALPLSRRWRRQLQSSRRGFPGKSCIGFLGLAFHARALPVPQVGRSGSRFFELLSKALS